MRCTEFKYKLLPRRDTSSRKWQQHHQAGKKLPDSIVLRLYWTQLYTALYPPIRSAGKFIHTVCHTALNHQPGWLINWLFSNSTVLCFQADLPHSSCMWLNEFQSMCAEIWNRTRPRALIQNHLCSCVSVVAMLEVLGYCTSWEQVWKPEVHMASHLMLSACMTQI